MFTETSRYHNQKTVDVTLKNGRIVKAVRFRTIPQRSGRNTTVQADDRLDIIAHREYNDPTLFWAIADANTELEAKKLVDEVGKKIRLPEP